MDLRYAQPDLTLIWDLRQKLKNWQVWELAVIKAREDLGKIPKGTYQIISEKLSQHEIDLDVIINSMMSLVTT